MLRSPAFAFCAFWVLCAASSARAGVFFTNMISFNGTNGVAPYGKLLQTGDGNFYGTTSGGYTNQGTVFKLSPNGMLTTLHSFNGPDGASPMSGLIFATDGNLYGTTLYGGTNTSVNNYGYIGDGTVFKISTNGTFTSLHSFDLSTSAYTNGAYPRSLIQGEHGDFYGTTAGGIQPGTVFRMTPDGAVTTLATFGGAYPVGPLIQDADGYLYGVTFSGGTNNSGTIFKISTNGVLTTLVSFAGTNGAQPDAGLIQGLDGYFYGTTRSGGTNNSGTIFRVKPDGTFQTVFSFGPNTGVMPEAQLLLGADGNLYGRTAFGSSATSYAPTLFMATPNGTLTVLYVLSGESNDSAGGLIQGLDGALYGTETYDGNNNGSVFRLSTPMQPILSAQVSSNSIQLSWNSVAGQRYQVQSNSTLDTNDWSDLGPAITATNHSMSASEIVGTDSPRFYQVVVMP